MDPLCAALESLPHGLEFRFLDRVLALEPAQSATGQYTVRGDEPFLKGHFPGEPLFPGVLLLEAAAQLAGIAAQSSKRLQIEKRLRLTAVRAVKILGTARPGQTIHFEARLTGRLGQLIQAEVKASIAGTLIMQGDLTLSQEL